MARLAGRQESRPNVNWFAIAGLVFQETSILEQDIAELAAGQPATSPSVDITVNGKKYAVSLTATPVA